MNLLGVTIRTSLLPGIYACAFLYPNVRQRSGGNQCQPQRNSNGQYFKACKIYTLCSRHDIFWSLLINCLIHDGHTVRNAQLCPFATWSSTRTQLNSSWNWVIGKDLESNWTDKIENQFFSNHKIYYSRTVSYFINHSLVYSISKRHARFDRLN